jgi:L-threonylcarbamoyladenylate synthase
MASGVPRWHWGEPTAGLAELLRRGGVLAIPSESSYGLGADPRNPAGVAAVCALKGRSAGKALPVVAADLAQLAALGIDLEDAGLRRVAALWPAALTVVARLRGRLPAALGGATLAVRLPAHPRLRVLLAELGHALTATSANTEGEPPILDPDALGALLDGAEAVIVDDGVLPGGPPSTLVEWTGVGLRVLRAGAFAIPPELLDGDDDV